MMSGDQGAPRGDAKEKNIAGDDEHLRDPFRLEDLFPEAEAIFDFQPKNLADVKDDCTVVLDTNVLLTPYGVSSNSLGNIESILSTLLKKGKLLLPAHVAREFARHRPEKLAEIYQTAHSAQSRATVPAVQSSPLLQDLKEYGEVKAAEEKAAAALRDYQKAVGELLGRIRSWNWDDPVALLYKRLFSKDVIVHPTAARDLLQADLKRREVQRIPPGYKDAGKLTNSAGDLLIWHTILDIGRRLKGPVLFVSGEIKSDWCYTRAGAALYPRYELVDEFRRESGGAAFYLSPFAAFLKMFGAKPEVVDEVRREERLQLASRRSPDDEIPLSTEMTVARCVLEWLLGQYQCAASQLVWVHEEGVVTTLYLKERRIHVAILYTGSCTGEEFEERVDMCFEKGRYRAKLNKSDFHLCVVTDVPLHALTARAQAAFFHHYSRSQNCRVSVGFLQEGHFYVNWDIVDKGIEWKSSQAGE